MHVCTKAYEIIKDTWDLTCRESQKHLGIDSFGGLWDVLSLWKRKSFEHNQIIHTIKYKGILHGAWNFATTIEVLT